MSPRGRGPRPETRVVLVVKRGRFLVGEPLFERGASGLDSAAGPRVGAGPHGAGGARAPGRAKVLRRSSAAPTSRATWSRRCCTSGGLRRGFPRAVEDEAAAAAVGRPRSGGERRDLTELPTFTVDPATRPRLRRRGLGRRRPSSGIRLWIHIADVAAHVRPGQRAGSRGLPPRQPRPTCPARSSRCCPVALAATPAASPRGSSGWRSPPRSSSPRRASRARPSFYRSLIRSDARLDYDELDQIFAGRAKPPSRLAEPLALARQAAAALADAPAAGVAGGRELRARVPVRGRQTWSAPTRSRRPRPTA